MPLVLHKLDLSPPCRTVFMTLEILRLEAEMVDVNTLAGESRKPEFVAKSPAHTVPLLEDGDFILSDSHAIITYLVSKYGADKRQDLYPNDFNLRATIDQRMYFDACVLFPKFRNVVRSMFTDGAKAPTPEQIADVEEEAYGILEKYLEIQPFIAHDRLTLADVCIACTLSSLTLVVPISDKFPMLTDWFGRIKDTEVYQKANEPGVNQFTELLNNKM